MRLIDADALIKKLEGKEEEEYYGWVFNYGDVFDAIDELSTVEQSRWIPCSERLPEKGKVVLITNDKGNVRCGQYRGLWSANVNEWTFRGNVIETVVAWMPLPEDYEAESEK